MQYYPKIVNKSFRSSVKIVRITYEICKDIGYFALFCHLLIGFGFFILLIK